MSLVKISVDESGGMKIVLTDQIVELLKIRETSNVINISTTNLMVNEKLYSGLDYYIHSNQFCLLYTPERETLYSRLVMFLSHCLSINYNKRSRNCVESEKYGSYYKIAGTYMPKLPEIDLPLMTYKSIYYAPFEILRGDLRYVRVHKAARRGYVPIDFALIDPYCGKFGEGFTIKRTPNKNERLINIYYYVKRV